MSLLFVRRIFSSHSNRQKEATHEKESRRDHDRVRINCERQLQRFECLGTRRRDNTNPGFDGPLALRRLSVRQLAPVAIMM